MRNNAVFHVIFQDLASWILEQLSLIDVGIHLQQEYVHLCDEEDLLEFRLAQVRS